MADSRFYRKADGTPIPATAVDLAFDAIEKRTADLEAKVKAANDALGSLLKSQAETLLPAPAPAPQP